MRLGTSCIVIVLGLFATSPASAQDQSASLLTRFAERFRPHRHTHTHTHTAAPQPQATAESVAPVAVEPEPEPAPAAETNAVACECPTGADPYGFMGLLNRVRASAGLHPVAYDPNLSSWASQNNAEQCRRGLGHHVNPAAVQNCAWNYPDANSTVEGWMNSPGHRRNMLAPEITHFGIAFGPGPYWTLNAR
ncbi:CAP domain-containing protein [Paludisphaera borealis]|uniref:SCP domain-containing protein n=1 Tax=Paludisphaera borealis TaxID=1387353 RepID=A0A1U7CYZ8_9BACT|nr:CAP domain-containing protein [Paludisphaera borealis]APW64155.1 hypothetical protein BSF38_05747 [Paludisphaera borealis]MDR3618320.1 CAP domain-containing protein [Paludisphaera borealis]